MPEQTYYNNNGKLPGVILADIRYKSGNLTVHSFANDKNFFDFLHKKADTEDMAVEHIWKYTAGGRLHEQEVVFKGKLLLIPVELYDDEMPE